MTSPGPPALGRGVIVGAGAQVPAAWSGATEVVVDESAVTAPETVVTTLHHAWAERRPVVVRLLVEPASFRAPQVWTDEPWTLDPAFEPWLDRLHHLVWSNAYDARTGEPVWWWSAKATRLGATAGGPADVLLADGTPAWIDGGPRGPIEPTDLVGCALVHRDAVEAGHLAPQPSPRHPGADLAVDQLAAVAHGPGPARIIAPAGSGKTRVLTERARHLVRDRSYDHHSLVAVAFNVRAKQEMESRTTDLPGFRVQTLNGLGWWIVRQARGNLRVLDEREVRGLVDTLVPGLRRKTNTDPVAPYLDGLSRIRLGLADPKEVEYEIDDADGLATEVWPRWRAALAKAGGVDFDEQVYGAVEALLVDGDLRRWAQERCRHLLVDEFQDLTPCHVLLLRLLSAPGYDVFGVGDDDQVIYGYLRASPRFLVDFADFFPGAASHPLEVNHRCPAPVVTAASALLKHNVLRVPKTIRPGETAATDAGSFVVTRHTPEAAGRELLGVVEGWLAEAGVSPADVAVLARVNSLLLAPHVVLHEAGIPVSSELGEEILRRTGIQAALAYLRLAAAPGSMSGADVAAILKRPSRGGLPRWLPDRLQRRGPWTVRRLRALAGDLDKDREADNLTQVADDLELVATRASGGVRAVLESVRDDVGLGQAMSMLDASKGAGGGSNVDDLEALIQLADLHDDVHTFESWLRSHLTRERGTAGVTLASVHRVKGQEWDHVVLFGITDGVSPHRLADDLEEERRIVHVGITRGRRRVVVLGDAGRASPFLDELEGRTPATPARRRPPMLAMPKAPAAKAEPVRTGDPDVTAALRSWRSERSKSEGKPAYIYLTDALIDAIATTRPDTLFGLRALPGMGPKKLDDYGEELLDVLRSVPAPPDSPSPA